jgi:hypothetical protein
MGEIGTEVLALDTIEGLAELFEEHRDALLEVFVDEKDRRDGYAEPRYAGEVLKGEITIKIVVGFQPKTGSVGIAATATVKMPKRQVRGVAGLLHDQSIVLFPSADKTQQPIPFAEVK